MSEKVGILGRGLQRVEVPSYGRENSQESNVLSDFFFCFFFFSLPKERHNVLVILDTVIVTQVCRRFLDVPNLIREVSALRRDV